VVHPLEGVRPKLARAGQHIEHLNREFAVFFWDKPYRFASHFDGDRETLSLRFELLTEPRAEWGVLLGETVHNLRSALDHLAWQLVDRNGGTTSRWIQFPIFKKESDYFGWRKPGRRRPDPFAGVCSQVVAGIEALQPYKRRNDPENHPLAILNGLSNHDKHKLLVPTFVSVRPLLLQFLFKDVTIEEDGGREFVSPVIFEGGRLDVDMELGRWRGRATGQDPHVIVQGNPSFGIALPEGRPVIETLRDIQKCVIDGALGNLARFL